MEQLRKFNARRKLKVSGAFAAYLTIYRFIENGEEAAMRLLHSAQLL